MKVKKNKLPTAKSVLTQRQHLFIIAYLTNGWNGVEAARTAGYSGSYNTLGVVAHTCLNKPKVKQAVERGMKEAGLTETQITARLGDIGRASLSMFIDDKGKIKLKAVKRYGYLVRSYEPAHGDRPAKITLHDPLRAIEMAARVAGMFQDRVELTGSVTETKVQRIEVVVVRPPKQVGNGAPAEIEAEVEVTPTPGNGT